MPDSQARAESDHHPRGYPDFFSSARSLWLPRGSQIRPGELGGYYIDFSLKATEPYWPPSWLVGSGENHVVAAQWGLACFERHRKGEGEAWLAAGVACARAFLDEQDDDGGWTHPDPMTHSFRVEPPWLSAMAQGEGASLLVRAHAASGDDSFAEAALRALRPMAGMTADGGVRAPLGSGFFLEEYPTNPPSHVLNGGIFALWGYYDVAVVLGDADARSQFEAGVDALAENLHRWDTGAWSRYDLMPGVVNVASSFYHSLHIAQLSAMQLLAPRPQVAATLERFEAYRRSRPHRLRAFMRKALFRVLVPRHRLIAHRTPFGRARRQDPSPRPVEGGAPR
jgi:heparosan-N-sulfate-glucuronate 5-epimerase